MQLNVSCDRNTHVCVSHLSIHSQLHTVESSPMLRCPRCRAKMVSTDHVINKEGGGDDDGKRVLYVPKNKVRLMMCHIYMATDRFVTSIYVIGKIFGDFGGFEREREREVFVCLFSVVEWSGVRMMMCDILYGRLDDRSIRYVDLRYRKDVGDFEREREITPSHTATSLPTPYCIYSL